jgi:hypothetical protein
MEEGCGILRFEKKNMNRQGRHEVFNDFQELFVSFTVRIGGFSFEKI